VKKFGKKIVQRDLSFEFEDKTLTGLEKVDIFTGRVILASIVTSGGGPPSPKPPPVLMIPPEYQLPLPPMPDNEKT
jgi:hypothetical protein